MHKGPKQVSIIGFGRFGQLLASILQDDFDLLVHDPDITKKKTAKSQGFTEVGLNTACAAEVVYLCVPISAVDEVSRQMAGKLNNSLVIDTCSVKIHPMQILESNLGHAVEILGGHPLFGPDSASSLKGKKMVFCPQNVGHGKLKFWEHYWRSKDLEVIEMTADEHDRQAAYSQGIAHFLGRVLDELELGVQPVTTKGYLDLLDLIAQTTNDSQQLFDDLQHYNPYTRDMRTDLSQALNNAKIRLDNLVKEDTDLIEP